MSPLQPDLFAQDQAERNTVPQAELDATRVRLEAVIQRLAATAVFPWKDTLQAALEENAFERGARLLGVEGETLWARFDKEMDRLFATPE